MNDAEYLKRGMQIAVELASIPGAEEVTRAAEEFSAEILDIAETDRANGTAVLASALVRLAGMADTLTTVEASRMREGIELSLLDPDLGFE